MIGRRPEAGDKERSDAIPRFAHRSWPKESEGEKRDGRRETGDGRRETGGRRPEKEERKKRKIQ
ncbi:MAG: hypothetical protein JXN62_10645 [Bacteroidales bacterium]|nr:hypothetical protein [Bacteroidales bacterium]